MGAERMAWTQARPTTDHGRHNGAAKLVGGVNTYYTNRV